MKKLSFLIGLIAPLLLSASTLEIVSATSKLAPADVLILQSSKKLDKTTSPSSKLSSGREQMLKDLEFLHQFFCVSYAPMDWKEQLLDIKFSDEIAKASHQVKRHQELTTKEFQKIVRNVCRTVKDYHVEVNFYSTECATLPFWIQGVDGRYFISCIDQDEIDPTLVLSVGDEVLSFNGLDIHCAVQEFIDTLGTTNHPETDRALAELYFTRRLGSKGLDIPSGAVRLITRPVGMNSFVLSDMEWDYEPEAISSAPMYSAMKAMRSPKASLAAVALKQLKSFATPHEKTLDSKRLDSKRLDSKRLDSKRLDSERPPVLLGSKKSVIPPLGEIVWSAPEDNGFHAYIFVLPSGKNAGYLRIPTYQSQGDGEELVENFSQIIEEFQEKTDVLVIDQLNNPGGSVIYLYALLGMLTDYPLKVPKHRLKLTQEDVYNAATLAYGLNAAESTEDLEEIFGNSFDGLPVDSVLAAQLLLSCNFVVDQWNEGKLFTDFHSLFGVEMIAPNSKVRYTKPMLVLINSLDFSGADFFPAIMQDNQRAVLMGSRTAGAGGYVETIKFTNLSGIETISLTASFAQRPDGRPIENVGVTPDLPYEISSKDLQDNYVEYKNKIVESLEDELKKYAKSN
ncbi:MAG: protease-like activity factor CPAF [Parachlamydiaceae bacterium]